VGLCAGAAVHLFAHLAFLWLEPLGRESA
jgi:hypothetical protein